MANVRIPQGFWAVLTAVFALLTLLFLVKGMFLMVIVALAMAVFTGLEATGNGLLPGRDEPRKAAS